MIIIIGVDFTTFDSKRAFDFPVVYFSKSEHDDILITDFYDYGEDSKYFLPRFKNNFYIIGGFNMSFEGYKKKKVVDLSKLGNFVQTDDLFIYDKSKSNTRRNPRYTAYKVKLSDLVSEGNPILDVDFVGNVIVMNNYYESKEREKFFKSYEPIKRVSGLEIGRDLFSKSGITKK